MYDKRGTERTTTSRREQIQDLQFVIDAQDQKNAEKKGLQELKKLREIEREEKR